MYPSVQIGDKNLNLYSVAVLCGLLFAGAYGLLQAKKRGLDINAVLDLCVWSLGGILVGSHLLYALVNLRDALSLFGNPVVYSSLSLFGQALAYIFGGAVFYGGLFGGLLVGWLWLKRKKTDPQVVGACLVPAIPLFHFFGRIGCFLGGCCYGIPSPYGFTFTHSLLETANGVSRFPIQLVESGFNLLLFFALHYLANRKEKQRWLLIIYLSAYGLARFVFEFFRGDVYRGFFWGLSTSQWISLGVLAAVGGYLFVGRKKPSPDN